MSFMTTNATILKTYQIERKKCEKIAYLDQVAFVSELQGTLMIKNS